MKIGSILDTTSGAFHTLFYIIYAVIHPLCDYCLFIDLENNVSKVKNQAQGHTVTE